MATDFGRIDEQYSLQDFVPQSSPTQAGPIRQSPLDTSSGGYNPPTDIIHQVQSSYEQKKASQQAAIDGMRSSLEASSKKQSSFWPTFTAVAAALSGNFGPAIQLQEQKRKTAIAKDAFPHMVKINETVNSGDLEGATAMANVLATSFGPRSPELAAHLSQIQSQLNIKNRELQDQRIISKGELATMPKEHPNYKLALFKKKLADEGTPLSMEMYKVLDQSSRIHQQNMGGMTHLTSPLTMQTLSIPYAEAITVKDVDNFAGLNVSAAYGITPTDLRNSMVGQTVKDQQGNDIEPNSAKAQEMRQDFIQLQPLMADLGIANLNNLEPTLQAQLIEKVGTVNAAARRFGGTVISDAIVEHLKRQQQQQENIIQAGIDKDPRMAQQAGFVFWDARKTPSFGKPVMSSIGAANASGGDIQYASEKQFYEKMVPAMHAKTAFEGLPQLFNEINKTVGWKGRITAEVKQQLSNRFGVGFEEGQEVGQALRMSVNRAVEEVGRTMNISDAEVGRMKALLTKGLANPEEATRAVNELVEQLNDRLRTYGGTLATEQPARQRPGRPSATPQASGVPARPVKTGEAAEYKRETERLRQQEQGTVPVPQAVQQQQQQRKEDVKNRKGTTTFGDW